MADVIRTGFQKVFRHLGPIFPKLSSRLARKIWFTNFRFKKSHTEQKIADTARPSSLEVNGTSIRVWQWGESGPPILFVHGWSGRGTQIASYVKPLVDKGFRVISFDAPAHGESGGKHTHIFHIVDALSALLKETGPAHGFITHSMGAMVLALLLDEKPIAERFVLLCPPTNLTAMLHNFQNQLSIPDQVIENLRVSLVEEFGHEVEEELSLLNKTHQFKAPVLIIHDENDEELHWEASEDLAQKIPAAEFHKTQGLGHIRVLYDASVINEVSDFFSTR